MIRYDKPLCIQIIFYSKYLVVLFILFWIFLVRCSSRSIVIFLIVSKEIQKYDQRKFYFFQKRNIFKFGIHVYRRKKNRKKNLQFFLSVDQNSKTKKFAISKLSNKKFRKIHYFAKIKYKRNSRKYCEKNLRRNIFVERKKNFAKKKFDKKIFTNKKFVEKIFVKKNFAKKKFEKKMFTKKKFVETNFRRKNFRQKTFDKKIFTTKNF